MQIDIFLHVCIIFQNSYALSYLRIQQIKLSFLHIRILILLNFSLFLICLIFNIIDHTRILNFIICICTIKLHIHLYKFSNIVCYSAHIPLRLSKIANFVNYCFIKRSGRNLSVDFFYTLEKLEYLKWFKGVWVYIPNQKFDSLRISIPRVIKSLEKIKYIDFA